MKIPKAGGVRKGWQRAYAIVCDFKVFLHEPSNDDIHSPAAATTHVYDIRLGIMLFYVHLSPSPSPRHSPSPSPSPSYYSCL